MNDIVLGPWRCRHLLDDRTSTTLTYTEYRKRGDDFQARYLLLATATSANPTVVALQVELFEGLKLSLLKASLN